MPNAATTRLVKRGCAVARETGASSGATWSRFDPIEIYFTGPVTGGPGTNWMTVWNRTGVLALKDMYPSGE